MNDRYTLRRAAGMPNSSAPRPLKIHSDRTALPASMRHVIILYPFWGKAFEDHESADSTCYQRYVDAGRNIFELTEFDDAELIIFPAPWELARRDKAATDAALQLAERARRAGKIMVVFFLSDSDAPLPFDSDVVVFRTSLYRSKSRPNDFAMPGWSEDFIEDYMAGELKLRMKREKPTVGFCGFVDHRVRHALLKDILYRSANKIINGRSGPSPYLGHVIRARAIRELEGSASIASNFILRDGLKFFGQTEQMRRRARTDFVRNMIDSDYTLCCRGHGNFSYRLYETLSMGRIPVFINTDCVLPYAQDINWKQLCVWIETSEIQSLSARIAEFHARLSADDFVVLQQKCRRVWEEWISPLGFFRNLYRHFT